VIYGEFVTLPQFKRKQGQLRAALKAAVARLAPYFPNRAARASAAAYLQSLLSSVERKNSWQLAEAVGLANPYPFQHLLGRAHWDAELVRDAHCQEVLAGLGQNDAVLAIDETGFIKQGKKSAGVARQYCGASGKIDNCQVGVFLSWQTAKGHALIDRALYLPQEWTQEPERCAQAGIPEDVTFATKPELARRMVERALEAGARPAWVVADSVYGADGKLRFFLEEREQPYVMAVTSAQSVWTGLTQRRVKSLVALAPADAWQRLKVGAGTKGPRLFDWAAVAINHPYEPRSWQRSRVVAPVLQRSGGHRLLLGLWPGRHTGQRTGRGGGAPLGRRGGLCARQRRGWPGSVRSAFLGGLAPAHDAGDGGPRPAGPDAGPPVCPRRACLAGDSSL
jgi:SRSO17 transposase